MHAIRRFSLRPLHDLAALPRRLSEALLGPLPEDGLPRSAHHPASSSSSTSGGGIADKISNQRRSTKGGDRLSLPRKLSLALLAPLLGADRPADDDDDDDANADDLGSGEKDGHPTSPSHQRDSSRSALLTGPRIQRHQHRPTPSLFVATDLFGPSSPLRSASPSPVERVDPLEPTGGLLVGRRRSSDRGAARRTSRLGLLAALLVALILAASVTGQLLGRSSATAASATVPGRMTSASTSDGSGVWPSWRPSPLTNSSWLGWTSSSSGSTQDEGEVAGAVDGHDPFVERNLYRRFPAPPFVDVRAAPGRADVLPVEILNDRCLESWIGQGVPCSREVVQSEQPPKLELDVVFTWVNGSDPRWEVQRAEYLNQTEVSPEPPAARHYRSNKDELRHSLRSVMSNVMPAPSRVHLVLGDWEDRAASASPGGRRGQLPGWLAWNEGSDGSPTSGQSGRLAALTDGAGSPTAIHVHHHSELFRTPISTTADEHAAFVRASTPTFNSFAIESMLHNIDVGAELATTIVYLNDDFFLLQPHTTADFGSPLLGPNLRLGDTFGYTIPYWEDPAVGCEHEWSSLLRSNWLLSRRFGFRSRLPFKHVAKTLSRPLLAEMHAIWPTQFASAAQRRFREQATGRFGDLNTSWLSSFLLIERSREAMLWVWAVARLGGVDGRWGAEERQAIKSLLGLTHGPSPDLRPPPEQPSVTTVEVKLGPRTTLDRVADGFAGLGIEGHMSTYPLWSSLDGYAPTVDRKCEINLDVCFGSWWSDPGQTADAAEMFARLAFGQADKCGDCLLAAVVSKSGPAGLSALLPDDGAHFNLSAEVAQALPHTGSPQDQQPHMPLTADWTTTSFALADVIAGMNPSDPTRPIHLRTFALRLIARYQFLNSGTNALFQMVSSPTNFGELVERLTTDPSIVSLGMNDDIEEQWVPVLEPLIKAYLDTKLAIRGWWERAVI